MLVILCPGQGSQKPGFMTNWLEIPEYKSKLQEFSEAISLDLIKHGTLSDEETIRDTAIAQPLIVGASIATAALLDTGNVSGAAGHSVGEVAAAAISGVLSETDAMRLVDIRAKSMAKAAKSREATSMAAILGGELETVVAKLNELGLSAANYNGAGQIVAAGSKAAIDKLAAEGLEGSKVIPLSVAGAFHTNYMLSAVSELEGFVPNLSVNNPSISLWSNQNGQLVDNGQEFVNLLVGQIANSVRWDLCMEAMVNAGVTAVIEVSPAGTLAGLAKRGMPGVEIVALKEPKDLEAAQDLINRSTKKV
ncbi:MAG: ACP S-malonyltransferase [Rhodoluna sp.]